MSTNTKNRSVIMHGRVRWLFFFAVLTLISFGIVLYLIKQELDKTRASVDYTYSVLKDIAELKSSLGQAESATRSLLITDDKNWQPIIEQLHEKTNILYTQIDAKIKNDTAFSSSSFILLKELIKNKDQFQKALLTDSTSTESIKKRFSSTGEGPQQSQAAFNILNKLTVCGEIVLSQRLQANAKNYSYSIYVAIIGAIIAFIIVLALIIQLNRDISRRKKAEESVGFSDERYKNLIENASMVMYTTDINGIITFANQQVGDLTGYSVEELIGKDFSFLLHPSWMQQVFNHYTQQFQSKTTSTSLEFVIRTKTGNQKWVEQTAQLIVKDEMVQGFQCMVRDITEKKKIELELKESELRRKENQLRLEAILENTTSLIFIKGLDGRYITINKRFKEVMGVTDEMVIGKTDYEFSEKEAGDHYKRLDEEVISTRKPVETEEWIFGPEGRKNLLVIKFPLIDHRKKIFGIGGIATDITDRVLYQQKLIEARKNAEEAKQLQEQFLANMSHEIRTPMNGIQGMTNLLLQTELNGQQKEFTSMIKRSVNNLLVIVNDILDFSKIKAGKITLDKVPFQIREVFSQIKSQFELDIAQKKLALIIDYDMGLPDTVIGDPYRLNQVLVNIVGNAVKFTVSGEIRIKTDVIEQTGNKATIRFIVSDTGMGVPDEKKQIIFEPFTQAGPEIARNYGGAGLGLSICKGLLGLQGGTIEFANKSGGGAEFIILIPYEVPQEQAAERDESQLLKGKHFLVVEDNEVNQKLVSYVLKKVGGTVDIANNGRVAIDLLEQKKTTYDLIIMDLQMPVMDGYEATEYIRNTLQLQIPIIAMTATALKGDRDRSVQVGMNDFMLKPFDFDDLYKRLIRLLIKDSTQSDNHDTMNSRKLYDLSLLEGLDDKDSLLDVLNLFLENTPVQMTELAELSQKEEWDALYQLAHKLKGALAMLQATHISELLGKIEAGARERKEIDQIPAKVAEVCTLFDQMKVQLIEEKEQIMGQ
ncbi:MAG: PAS domain S-box protein [Chitinophagaceae bacterium]|nr:PAS domain S-box protein [Chitinophagaceae bacterium]